MSRVCLAAAVVVLLIGAAAPASAGPPSATTSPASSIGSTTVTLNGLGNPNGEAATGWFRYAFASPGTCNDSFGTRAPSSGGAALGSGSSPVSYSQGIVGLIPGASYYFCAIVSNGSGTSFGALLTFSTATGGPTVTTSAASSITAATATLNGSANPNGDATTGWFRYDSADPGACDDSFGTRAPSSGGSAPGLRHESGELQPGDRRSPPADDVLLLRHRPEFERRRFRRGALVHHRDRRSDRHHLRCVVDHRGHGDAQRLRQPQRRRDDRLVPLQHHEPGHLQRQLRHARPIERRFRSWAPARAPVVYSEAIAGLAPRTTYYFCAIAQNSNGIGFGAVLSFTTAGPPTVTTAAASLITAATATLNGSANPNGDATTGWFRYSTTSPGTCNDSFGTRAPSSGGSAPGLRHESGGL